MNQTIPLATNSTQALVFEDIKNLLRDFGSPLYVYDHKLLLHQLATFSSLFGGIARVFFASFCNSNPTLLRLIRTAGMGCLASSKVEVEIAERAGFGSHEILVTGSAFSEAELKGLIAKNVAINLDSFGQLELFARLATRKIAGVRVSVETSQLPSSLPINTCIGTTSRVGVLECELEDFIKRANELSVAIDSLHVYTGTNQLQPDLLLTVAERLLEVSHRFEGIKDINLGGGFGLPYVTGERQEFPWAVFLQKLCRLRHQFQAQTGRSIGFVVEPGRALIGPVGWLAATVTDVKVRSDGAIFIGTDASLSNFPRPYIYGAKGQHPVTLLTQEHRVEPILATICGNALASGDRLGEQVPLPCIPRVGEIVVIHDAGAYGYSMSSQFSGRLRPAEILLMADGQRELIRRRETLDEALYLCEGGDCGQQLLKLVG